MPIAVLTAMYVQRGLPRRPTTTYCVRKQQKRGLISLTPQLKHQTFSAMGAQQCLAGNSGIALYAKSGPVRPIKAIQHVRSAHSIHAAGSILFLTTTRMQKDDWMGWLVNNFTDNRQIGHCVSKRFFRIHNTSIKQIVSIAKGGYYERRKNNAFRV